MFDTEESRTSPAGSNTLYSRSLASHENQNKRKLGRARLWSNSRPPRFLNSRRLKSIGTGAPVRSHQKWFRTFASTSFLSPGERIFKFPRFLKYPRRNWPDVLPKNRNAPARFLLLGAYGQVDGGRQKPHLFHAQPVVENTPYTEKLPSEPKQCCPQP